MTKVTDKFAVYRYNKITDEVYLSTEFEATARRFSEMIFFYAKTELVMEEIPTRDVVLTLSWAVGKNANFQTLAVTNAQLDAILSMAKGTSDG